MAEAYFQGDLFEEAMHIQNVVTSESLENIVAMLEQNIDDPKRMQKVAYFILAKELDVDVLSSNCSNISKSTRTDQQKYFKTENEHSLPHTRYAPVTDPAEKTDLNLSIITFEAQPGPSSMVADIQMNDGTQNYKSKGKTEEYKDKTIVIDDSIIILDDGPELATNYKKHKYVKTLKDMFPDIDLAYLEDLCKTANQNPQWLDETITELLKGDYLREISVDILPNSEVAEPVDEESLKIIVEKNYSKFLEILPNADPTYLRDAAERCGNDERAVTALITELFETKNYPTFKDCLNRQKTISIQRKYIDCFNVEEFLEIFPDPVKYFSDRNRCNGDGIDYDLTYLKARYRGMKLETIREIYHQCRNNLTRACSVLDKCENNMKRLRRDHEIKYPEAMNISFIQEIAFIENKEYIINFLKQKVIKREAAYKEAKEKGELFECSCCYDGEVLREDIVACDEGHLFCRSCVQKYVETCIGDGKTSFPCLTICDVEFSLQTLQGVLKASVFSRLLQKKQSEEVNAAGIPGLENCPFCDFAMIPPPDDKVFRCLNSECMKLSCRNCRGEDHIPLRCEEVEKSDEIKLRTFIEDKMTEALVRICWKCKKKFIKEDGCNKMTCVCGAMMCYFCRQPVTDYKHFNGQGGTEYNKCPLYTNNRELHLKAVLQEGKKAKALALSENPDIQLKHDPTKAFPQPTTSNRAVANRDNAARIQRKRRHDDS